MWGINGLSLWAASLVMGPPVFQAVGDGHAGYSVTVQPRFRVVLSEWSVRLPPQAPRLPLPEGWGYQGSMKASAATE